MQYKDHLKKKSQLLKRFKGPKKEITFKQDCQTMKDALTQIKNDSQTANKASVEDQLKVALNGLEKDEGLNCIVSYYHNRKHYKRWGSFLFANYNSKSIAYMLHFLKSMEIYYEATLELIVYQRQALVSPTINTKPAYKGWQIIIKNSLNNLDQVLKFV